MQVIILIASVMKLTLAAFLIAIASALKIQENHGLRCKTNRDCPTGQTCKSTSMFLTCLE